MVTGKLIFPLAKPNVDGPTVDASNGSLRAIWMAGIRETPEAPFGGDVDVIVSEPIGAVAASTVKALFKGSVCAPTVTLMVRAPSAAKGSIANWAVALVGLVTVSAPGCPSGAPATLIPGPKLASVWAGMKFVLRPLRTTVRISPAFPAVGLMEVRVAFGFTGAAFTAMVTVLEVFPLIEITTGTAPPAAEFGGTSAFTWYSPTNPGARPETLK